MFRLFVALAIPEEIADRLLLLRTGLHGARWRPRENLHLTLRFIGETDGPGFAEAASALSAIDAPAFDLKLSGCGQFGERRPRAIWAGAEPNPALSHLQAKVDTAIARAGFGSEGRKFAPHVTLAYLSGARPEKVAQFCAGNGLFSTPAFPVSAFHLYSSQLGSNASVYRIEQSYSLSPSHSR